MKAATKEFAKEVWDMNIGLTTWKYANDALIMDKPISAARMLDRFLEKGFDRAEANCIVAALVMAGAKFTEQ